MQLEPTADKTLLIIEDELDMRELLLTHFTDQGWSVLFSLTLPDIKRLLTAATAVLMDWKIPGLDSQELYKTCRAKRPCVVVSGDLECPIPGVIRKPFRLAELSKVCTEAVERAWAGIDLFEDDAVESKLTPDWGAGRVVELHGDDCWVEFPQAPPSVRNKPIRVLKTHLRKLPQ